MKRMKRTIDIRSIINPEFRRVIWMTGATMGWMLIPVYAFTSPDWADLIMFFTPGMLASFASWQAFRKTSLSDSGGCSQPGCQAGRPRRSVS